MEVVYLYVHFHCMMCYLLGQIPRKQWVKLNRLRCGTARVGDTFKLCGAQESAMYYACGHITRQCSMLSLTACYIRPLMALLVSAVQMQQLGIGWMT